MNLSEAKARLAELVRRAEAGEDVVIARRNRPRVRLVVIDEARPRRRLGIMKGEVWMSDDFDAPLTELADYE